MEIIEIFLNRFTSTPVFEPNRPPIQAHHAQTGYAVYITMMTCPKPISAEGKFSHCTCTQTQTIWYTVYELFIFIQSGMNRYPFSFLTISALPYIV